MSLYRNRDIHKTRWWQTLALYLILAAGIAFLFQRDFANTRQMILISASAAAVLILFYLAWQYMPARMRAVTRHVVESHRQSQGRLTLAECRQKKLTMTGAGLPLGSLQKVPEKRHREMIGLPLENMQGHLLVAGATRSGKGMHLTQALLSADCAAVIIDPKGEQYERTAGYRAEHVGPVYRLPGNTLDLMDYYDLGLNSDLTELHYHLMKPWADKQSIFADKVKFVFAAAHAYGREHGLNPLQVLLDAAESAPADTLGALAKSHYEAVMNFTNGDDPAELDKFAASSWGSFGTRLFDYQQQWHTITSNQTLAAIPLDWAAQKATIYITYRFDELKGVGGVVSAVVAALLRYQKMHDRRDQLLAAVDELPTVGLRNIDEYLSTVGGYGITLILYVQSYAQLADIYGERKAETILANCQHQVWYPPADSPTAKRMSELYGTKMEPFQSFSRSDKDRKLELDLGTRETSRGVNLQVRPALAPEEMEALDSEEVIVRLGRQHVAKVYRLWPVPLFKQLPPPAYEVEAIVPERKRPLWGRTNASETIDVSGQVYLDG